MAPFLTARSIYLSICDDPAAIAAISAAASTLALAIATDANGSARVTSATMNGQSFAATDGMPPVERLAVLRMVLKMAENGSVPSRTLQPRFV